MSMTPKLCDLTQGRGHLMIKPYEGGEWRDLGDVVSDAISIETKYPKANEITLGEPIKVTLTINVNTKKIRKAILKLIGKPGKTTYKTMRHDCAKRNGRR